MTELRAQKLNRLIKKELGKIIFDFLDFTPDVLVTITRVTTAQDLFSAIVFISVWPDNKAEEFFGKLNRSVYHIQQSLNKKLRIRPVPKIIFRYDMNPEEASKVEKLIMSTKEK